MHEFLLIVSFISIAFIGYYLGVHRNEMEVKQIEKIIVDAQAILAQKSLDIINQMIKKYENESVKNTEILIDQNDKAINVISRQTLEINNFNKQLAIIRSDMNEQKELYERISMLQKIIVKKKKLDI